MSKAQVANSNKSSSANISRKKSIWKRLRNEWDIQLMILPGILFLIIIYYVPMYGVLLAFQDFNIFKGFFDSPWAGLKHFEAFFSAPEFGRVMRNTIIVAFLKLVFTFPAPIFLA